jgi:DTW domain-containing protein YfiP
VPSDFHRLRDLCALDSTRPYKARGFGVERCKRCFVSPLFCMCTHLTPIDSRHEFVLLLHRNELFKPSNTGQLIAQLLRDYTRAYCWDRTSPSKELLACLNDTSFTSVIVFPSRSEQSDSNEVEVNTSFRPELIKLESNTRYRFIFLDGTWRQASRMFRLSRWLDKFPTLLLTERDGGYRVRKAHKNGLISTAEAAVECLLIGGEPLQAEALSQVFKVFNLRYEGTRRGFSSFEALNERLGLALHGFSDAES